MTALMLPFAVLVFAIAWEQHAQAPMFAHLANRNYPNPNSERRSAMPDYGTATTTGETETVGNGEQPPVVGELETVPEAPILGHADTEIVEVIVNVGLARKPNGHHAIKVILPGNGTITADQAHQLHLDLDHAAAFVSGLRQDPGYNS